MFLGSQPKKEVPFFVWIFERLKNSGSTNGGVVVACLGEY
jgi:hypothetical protein